MVLSVSRDLRHEPVEPSANPDVGRAGKDPNGWRWKDRAPERKCSKVHINAQKPQRPHADVFLEHIVKFQEMREHGADSEGQNCEVLGGS